MEITTIFAVVEPATYSLNNSLSWALVSGLKSGVKVQLQGSDNDAVGVLDGVVPILQPISAKIRGNACFIQFFRGVCSVSDAVIGATDLQWSAYAGSTFLGHLLLYSAIAPASPAPMVSIVWLSPQLPALDASTSTTLLTFAQQTTRDLWRGEPINWTTHRLLLASDADFSTADQILKSGLLTGVVVIDRANFSVISGVPPVVTPFKTWRGAGKATILVTGIASASCGTDTTSDGSSSGGDSDSHSTGGDGGQLN